MENRDVGLVWFNPLWCFFCIEGHVALDRNPGTGYNTLLLRMIPGDLLSAFPHRLPGLLDSWAAVPNSNPNACMPMQGGSLYHFYDGLWYDSRPTPPPYFDQDNVSEIYKSNIINKYFQNKCKYKPNVELLPPSLCI